MTHFSCLMAGFDGAGLVGHVFNRGSYSVSVPATSSQVDGGRYWDALHFLNGYGVDAGLSAEAAAAWTAAGGAGTMSVGIDGAGLFYVHCTGAAAFTVTPGVQDPWGWGGVVAAVSSGTGKRATAGRAWDRGNVDVRTLVSQFTVTRTLGGAFAAPAFAGLVQSVPTILRTSATDYEGTDATLEHADNAATDATDKRVRWGIDNNGLTYVSRPTAVSALTWASTAAARALRFALGFTGAETESAVSGGRYVLRSTYPALGVLMLRQGLTKIDARHDESGSVVSTTTGEAAGRVTGRARQYGIAFHLGGPMAGTDDEAIALERFLSVAGRGSYCSLYRRWGDPRRATTAARAFDGTSAASVSESITSQLGGLEGRVRAYIGPESPPSVAFVYDPASPRVRTAEISMVLQERPDGE